MPFATEYVEIRQLVERYADAVNRVDAAAWEATWAEDAVWDLGAMKTEGRDKVVAFWKQVMPTFPFVVQIIHSGVVNSVDGDSATGTWYLSEYMHRGDGGRNHGIGVYRDDYVRVGGEWLFKRRRYSLLYNGPTDLSGQVNPHPEKVGV
ncbi:MAG: nuclear transport factor 2 family protein [Dehalococcoidia bacterium]